MEFIDLSFHFKRIPWLLYQDETVGLGAKIPIKVRFVIVNNGPSLPSVVISCFEVTSGLYLLPLREDGGPLKQIRASTPSAAHVL